MNTKSDIAKLEASCQGLNSFRPLWLGKIYLVMGICILSLTAKYQLSISCERVNTYTHNMTLHSLVGLIFGGKEKGGVGDFAGVLGFFFPNWKKWGRKWGLDKNLPIYPYPPSTFIFFKPSFFFPYKLFLFI